jgi:hypothetical protein
MTNQDLYELIDDVIKVHPDATDTDKLQGKEHRKLLKALVDYVVSVAGGSGDFPFDWATPSNAFNGYHNSETTFKAGMNKFLHRDTPPVITAFYAVNAVRERGADRAVTLGYGVSAGNSAITRITVDETIYNNPTVYNGSTSTSTDPNTDTVFAMSVKDAQNNVVNATTSVVYRDKRVAFTSSADLLTAPESAVINEVVNAAGELSDNRYITDSSVDCSGTKLYIAYPASFGNADKLILNDFEDNSFKKRTFNYTNAQGFISEYILYISENKLFGKNKISVK